MTKINYKGEEVKVCNCCQIELDAIDLSNNNGLCVLCSAYGVEVVNNEVKNKRMGYSYV